MSQPVFCLVSPTGRKVEVEDGIPSAPRSNFLYQNVRTVKTSPRASVPTPGGHANINRNNNTRKNRNARKDDLSEPERPASQISVHITSTKSPSEDGEGDERCSPERDITVTSDERLEAHGDQEVKCTSKTEQENIKEETMMKEGEEDDIREQDVDRETLCKVDLSSEEMESCPVNEAESKVCLESQSEETSGLLNKMVIEDSGSNDNFNNHGMTE